MDVGKLTNELFDGCVIQGIAQFFLVSHVDENTTHPTVSRVAIINTLNHVMILQNPNYLEKASEFVERYEQGLGINNFLYFKGYCDK